MPQSEEDPRTKRTRNALLSAFNSLVLETSTTPIRVADIIRQADVGRSTFYEHYQNADDIHMQALAIPLSRLADAIVADGDASRLIWLLEHFREIEARARQTFAGTDTRDKVASLLVNLVDERLSKKDGRSDDSLLVRQLAESALAMLRIWICNEVTCSAETLAETIIRSSELLREGLRIS